MVSDMITLLLANTLGESILVEVFKSAAYFITHSSSPKSRHYMTQNKISESRQCYFFIQGSGLDQLIEAYALEYDPQTLRNEFNFYVKHIT